MPHYFSLSEEVTTKARTSPKGVISVSLKKTDLVDALKEFREAILKKLDSDIDVTAMAFTNVKDYWRSKRWADILTAPLRVLEDTLIVLAKARDWTSLAGAVNTALSNSEATYQVLTTVMMLQDLKEVGEKLLYGLDGPTYVSSIEAMLEEADATYVPPFGDDWQKYYKDVIENHLYGGTALFIPRKSITSIRENIEFVRGALQLRSSIARKFNDLITEIEARDLPDDFPIDEVVAQLRDLRLQVRTSTIQGVDVKYKTYLEDQERYIETKLGAVASLYTVFGIVAGKVAEKIEIEQKAEVLKLMETAESAVLLCTISYNMPGVEEIKVVQKATTLAELSIKPYKKIFYTDVEDKFYMLPQEMVLALPIELSNLWMMVDDTDYYLRHLLKISASSVGKTTISHPWPMFGHDAQNTFRSPYEGPESPSIKWDVDLLNISSAPLISADDTIYLTALRDNSTLVFTVNPQGERKELAELPGEAAIFGFGPSGTLYLMFREEKMGAAILALDSSGKELWRTFLPLHPAWGMVVIGTDGSIYATLQNQVSEPQQLFVLSREGKQLWELGGICSNVAIAPDGTVYVCGRDGRVFAYDTQGQQKWQYDARADWPHYYSDMDCWLAVSPDGTVYVLPLPPHKWGEALYPRLLALSPSGNKKWHTDIPESSWGDFFFPAIGPDGSLYVHLESEVLYKVNPSGDLRELASVSGSFESVILIDSTNTIYVGGWVPEHENQTAGLIKSQLFAFRMDGSEKWRLPVEVNCPSLVMGSDGTIYVLDYDSHLYAIR